MPPTEQGTRVPLVDVDGGIRFEKERVRAILQRCANSIVDGYGWLTRAKQSKDLNCVTLSDEDRAGHLPKLVEDLAFRLSKSSAATKDSDAVFFRCCCRAWQAAISARLHPRNAGA